MTGSTMVSVSWIAGLAFAFALSGPAVAQTPAAASGSTSVMVARAIYGGISPNKY